MKSVEWGKNRQKIMAWAMGAALLLIVAICVVAIVATTMSKNDSVDVGVEEPEYGDVFDSWGEYVANKDMEGLIELTNKQLEATDDVETKAVIYASRAGMLYDFDVEEGASRYKDQVLFDVYKAEEFYPTGDTAYLIYVYEQAYGNDTVAEEYLKIAEERGEAIPPGRG